MSEKTSILTSILLTFFIGLIAGIAPFLFMDLLPSLLSHNGVAPKPNYGAIIVTGVLIGTITAIIFSKSFKEKEPQDIFFYALGIPAILIATISNLNTNFSATKKVEDVKASASAEVLSIDNMQPVIKELETIQIPLEDLKQSGFLFPKPAFAEDKKASSAVPSTGTFAVSIGEYVSQDDAVASYKSLLNKKLSTEKYVPKSLQVLKAGDSYVVIFSRHATEEEAAEERAEEGG